MMDAKKDLWLSLAGVVIVLIGAIVSLFIGFPAGLLILLPSAIPHMIRLHSLRKKSQDTSSAE
ncbi:MAG: hypothetical protein E7323_13325 [Clostridiales bacterium]|nr:hypothetical protein [Clostridiales bacterium]